MKLTRRQLTEIIRKSLIKEVGLGVGMDPLGATMPKGIKRSEYNQLGDAKADIHSLLAVTSIIDPTPVSDMVDAAVYVLQGDTDSAAVSLGSGLFGLGAGAAFAKFTKAFKSKEALEAAEGVTKEFAEDAVEEAIKKAAKTEAEIVTEIIESVPNPVSSKVVNMTTEQASRAAGKEITFDNCVKNVEYFNTIDGRHIYVVTDALDNTRAFYKSTGSSGTGHGGEFAEIEGFGYLFDGNISDSWFVKTHPNTKTAIEGTFDELISKRLKNLDYESPFRTGQSIEMTGDPQQLAIFNKGLKSAGVDTSNADIHLYGTINGWLSYNKWDEIVRSMPGAIK